MYLIRADGNAQIGAGHIMRCLTIADAIQDKKQVYFICADEQSAGLARSRGYQARALGTDYRRMEEELPFWEELPLRRRVTAENNPGTGSDGSFTGHIPSCGNLILVDSYYITPAYLRALGRYGRIALLDDGAQRAYPVDLVINYNVFASARRYEELYGDSGIRCCTGGSYIPIRPQFCGRDYRVRGEVLDVLITTGGGDSENIAGKILQRIYREGIRYHLVMGRYSPHFDGMRAAAECCSGLRVYHDVENMAELMRCCDAAVTAAGTTFYELAAVGVPLICFSYAENQEELARYVGSRHIAAYGGMYHRQPEKTLERINEKFRALCSDSLIRNMCYEKERRLVDGLGAHRIADALECVKDGKNF